MTHISSIRKVIFVGTPDFAVPALEKLSETRYKPILVITQPDKPQGRKLKLVAPPVKNAAIRAGIEYIQPESIRDQTVLDRLKGIAPDVIITAAYGGFLNKPVLGLPQHGCLNIHPSLLPKYRGATPINHTLFNGDKKTGISITKMILKMDSGDILRQKAIPVDDQDNYSTLSEKLALLGADEIIETLKDIESSNVKPVPQDEKEATYCYKLTKEDFLLNWEDKAENIHNKVRGLSEDPGAYTFFRGNKIKILTTSLLGTEAEGKPGKIDEVRKNEGIVVSCGDKKILLTRVQPAGKRVMKAFEFSIGARITGEEFFVSGVDNR